MKVGAALLSFFAAESVQPSIPRAVKAYVARLDEPPPEGAGADVFEFLTESPLEALYRRAGALGMETELCSDGERAWATLKTPGREYRACGVDTTTAMAKALDLASR